MPTFTTRTDMLTWLGPAADEMTAEQIDEFDRVAAAIGGRWPDPEDSDSRELALSAAAQVIVGDNSLEALAGSWRDARRVERERMAALTGALIATPGSERALEERSGVARATVRKALGKTP
jgi:hypothetical protein